MKERPKSERALRTGLRGYGFSTVEVGIIQKTAIGSLLQDYVDWTYRNRSETEVDNLFKLLEIIRTRPGQGQWSDFTTIFIMSRGYRRKTQMGNVVEPGFGRSMSLYWDLYWLRLYYDEVPQDSMTVRIYSMPVMSDLRTAFLKDFGQDLDQIVFTALFNGPNKFMMQWNLKNILYSN